MTQISTHIIQKFTTVNVKTILLWKMERKFKNASQIIKSSNIIQIEFVISPAQLKKHFQQQFIRN
jgi:hypothetical protein